MFVKKFLKMFLEPWLNVSICFVELICCQYSLVQSRVAELVTAVFFCIAVSSTLLNITQACAIWRNLCM